LLALAEGLHLVNSVEGHGEPNYWDPTLLSREIVLRLGSFVDYGYRRDLVFERSVEECLGLREINGYSRGILQAEVPEVDAIILLVVHHTNSLGVHHFEQIRAAAWEAAHFDSEKHRHVGMDSHATANEVELETHVFETDPEVRLLIVTVDVLEVLDHIFGYHCRIGLVRRSRSPRSLAVNIERNLVFTAFAPQR